MGVLGSRKGQIGVKQGSKGGPTGVKKGSIKSCITWALFRGYFEPVSPKIGHFGTFSVKNPIF